MSYLARSMIAQFLLDVEVFPVTSHRAVIFSDLDLLIKINEYCSFVH